MKSLPTVALMLMLGCHAAACECPVLVDFLSPKYAPFAWMAGVEGEITVRVSVDPAGHVASVLSTHDKRPRGFNTRLYTLLVEETEAALKQWRFQPCTESSELTVRVEFRIVTEKQGLTFVQVSGKPPSYVVVTAHVQPPELMDGKTRGQKVKHEGHP